MNRFKISDGKFQLEFPSRGKNSFVLLHENRNIFSYGRVLCGKFSEVGALEQKFRLHPNQDSLSAEIESSNIIPFGCEYEISRNMISSSRFLRITEDIRAVNFGRVGNLTLEEARMPADFIKLEYLVYGEKVMRQLSREECSNEIYSGNEPAVMVSVTFANNVKVDFGCGSDIWRLRSAANLDGVSAEFSIKIEDDELVISRQPLIYAEGTEIEQRPWRFKSIVSWHDGSEIKKTDIPEADSFANAPCMLAPAARREFRKKVRRSQNDLVCTGCVPALCQNASHLEKPEKKELCHFDLEEYITSFVWANRQLNKRDKKFRFAFEENIFNGTAAAANLSNAINTLEFEDSEQ